MKKTIAALVLGILIGWTTEYAYLSYQAHRAFEAQAAFMRELTAAIENGTLQPIPTPP